LKKLIRTITHFEKAHPDDTVTFDISDPNVIVERRPLPTSGRPIFEMIAQGLNFETNFERM
jgi:hypothetical protein